MIGATVGAAVGSLVTGAALFEAGNLGFLVGVLFLGFLVLVFVGIEAVGLPLGAVFNGELLFCGVCLLLGFLIGQFVGCLYGPWIGRLYGFFVGHLF